MDCGQKVGREAIVPGCDTSEVLEAAEHAFDGISVAVEIGREAVFPDAIGFGRDIGHCPLGFGQPSDLIAIVGLVSVQDPTLWQAFEKRQSRFTISNLAAGEIKSDRSALSISQSMDFSRSPTT
jgi:hypothetical protein